jgi:hypothetical protein
MMSFRRLCMVQGPCTEGSTVRPSASGDRPPPHLRSGLGLGSNRRRQSPRETSEVVPGEPPSQYREVPELGPKATDLGCTCKKGTVLKPVGGVAGCKRRIPRLLHVSATETVFEPSSESILDALIVLQQGDDFVQEKKYESIPKRGKNAGSHEWTSISVRNSRLLKRGAAYYVPLDVGFRSELLRCHHDDPVAGHFGFSRTFELLSRKYFWFGMRADVKRYVNTCAVCQRTKVKRHLPYGELSIFPLPSRPWQEIIMDFITGLPPSKHNGAVYDSILVVVDRFTKMVRYIHVTKTIDAPALAEIFVQKIFKDFGAPAGITTDRGTQFTSNFWSTFCFLLGVRRRLSTAFRPQTDGQTERQNQTLEHYLRCYCTYNQSDWASKLALAEFAYNNSQQSSTGMSPFRACYGFAPRIQNIEDDVPGGEAPLAKERIEMLARERVLLSTHLRSAQEYQKKFYDAKHLPRQFQIGDRVMIRSRNIKQLRPNVKLSDKYLGPFTILERIGNHGQAYRLQLPPHFRIHNVFHVSLIEPWADREGEVAEPPPVQIEDQLEWEVESVQDHREKGRGRQYLVRWKGYAPAEDTWEPEANLSRAQEVVREYWESLSRPGQGTMQTDARQEQENHALRSRNNGRSQQENHAIPQRSHSARSPPAKRTSKKK